MAPPLQRHGKTQVKLHVKILEVITIEEISSIFELKFTLCSEWIDSRLTYLNLQNDNHINVIEDTTSVWSPKYHLSNTNKNKDRNPLGEEIITVIPNHQFIYERSDLTESIKANKFSGKQNYLKKTETYQAVFNCRYDMHWYPFDIQICFMDIVTSRNLNKFMDLQPNGLDYDGNPVVFSQYTVLGKFICSAQIGDKVGIKVDFLLQRGLMSPFLTIYMPTLLINIIGMHITKLG